MSATQRAWARLRSMLVKDALDRDFDDEAQAHIDLAADDFVLRGMSRPDAERLARLKFGSMAASKDAHRDARGLPWLDGLLFDLRLAVRGLQRDRGYSITVIATLAVALALNVSVYTIHGAMVWRGMPLATDPTRLVYLSLRKPTDMACCPGPVRYADFEAWRTHAEAFQGVAFGPRREPIRFRADSTFADTTVSRQSTNMFGLLGIRPVVGRDFTLADEAPGAPAVAIISHEFWAGRLGSRGDVVGLSVLINDEPASIVGVMPKGFAIVFPQDLYMPLKDTASLEATVIARLKAGTSQQEARAQVEAITRRLEQVDGIPRGMPEVATYAEAHTSPDSPRIYGALWFGAWLVLLTACANLANLTLVRTIGRWRELSTRVALGGGPLRMARQMLMESLLLGTVGAALAWWIAGWSIARWAQATASRFLVVDYSVTAGTLAYLLATAGATVVVVAALPMARVMQLGAGEAIKGDARGVTQGLRGRHLTNSLVAGQMALATVLLLGAGVLVRSFENVVGAGTGLHRADQVAIGLVGLPTDKYRTPQARARFFARLEGELRSIAGTVDVAVASTIPVRGSRARPFQIDGLPVPPEAAQVIATSAGYFRALGRPALAGRDFTNDDDAAAMPVVIVNQSFADRFWPNGSLLGQRLRIVDSTSNSWRTVVGIAPNIMQGDPIRQSFKPVIYVPFQQQPSARAFVFVRSHVGTAPTIQATLDSIQRLDPSAVTEQFGSLQAGLAFDRDWMDLEHADLGKYAAIAPIFAVVALVVSALGLAAVVAHSVGQRTKEVGVRMAVGATSRDIAVMIVREGMRPVALGLPAGLMVAAATNRVLESQLVAVSPYDPLTLVGGPVVLAAVALLGCRVPAKRATQVDPVVALRHD